MSLSSRNCGSALLRIIAGSAGIAAASNAALAADAYFVPAISVNASHHSNLALDSTVPAYQDLSAYSLDAGAVIGWRTPRAVTELQPRALLTRYPDQDSFDSDELYLPFRTNYQGLKSTFELYAEYFNVDSITAERERAAFDPFDPQDPTVGGTGRVLTSTTVENFQLRPRYDYRVTDRTGVGAYLLADARRYSGDFSRSDYDFLFFNPYVSRSLDERTQLSFGGTASRYKTTSDSNLTEAYGVSLDLNRRWTPTYSGGLVMRVERNDIELRGSSVTTNETSTDWSFVANLERRGETDTFRMTAGQILSPSGTGFKTSTDEVRLEYGHPFSARWIFDTAVRGMRVREIGSGGSGQDDRDYAVGEMSIRWAMTRTWNVSAHYYYTWQKYELEADSNDNNSFYLGIGYQGLSPPPR
jgi:Omp85 superfamily domain